MRIPSFSNGRFLSVIVLSVTLLAGCASTPRSMSQRSHSAKQKPHDLKVHDQILTEISAELFHIQDAEAPLKGPVTLARAAEIQKEQMVRPTILSELIAAKGLMGVRAFAKTATESPPIQLKTLSSLETSQTSVSISSNETPFIFDIPVTYNSHVSSWIRWFQTGGRKSFKIWLERSSRYVPVIEDELQKAGLPQDLVYLAMIESGFRPDAASQMGAIGLWQFIASTGRHYGLNIGWWIDERRDFSKSTKAAIAYMKELNGEFKS